MTKVLLVPSSDYVGHPFPQRHNQIFERLHDDKEFEVHVLNFNLFNFKKLESKVILHELNGFNIKNVGQYYLVNGLKYSAELRKIIKKEGIDVIVFSNFAIPFLYTIMNTIQDMKIPIIFDIPDYYPTSAAGYLLDVNTLAGRLLSSGFELMFRYLLRNANVVTAASQALVDYTKQIGVKKVVYLPNGISKDIFSLRDGKKIREKYGFEDSEILVGYIGSIEFWLDMEPLIKGLAMALNEELPVKLLLVGKGIHTNYQKIVSNWLKKYEIEKYTVWSDFIDYRLVPDYMSSLDYGTIPFDVNNPTSYYAAPNKMWEYASQMTPILSSSIPEAKYFRNVLTITDSPGQYLEAIKKNTYQNQDIIQKTLYARKIALKRTWQESKRIMAETIKYLIK